MKNKGLSLVEVMVVVVILGIVSLMIARMQFFMSANTVRIKEKMYATEKAIQMMEELRALVMGSERTNIEVLDDFTDGTVNYILTTDRTITDPAHPNSGNSKIGVNWKYFRQVTIAPMAEEVHARRVEIKVYENSKENPGTASKVLAETTSVLRTISNEFVPTQVMDLYIIAIENVPGWWSDLSTMIPTFDSVLQDIQTRNQGMLIRQHWITRSAFGRDPYYKPYVNTTFATNAASMPQVYFYPGMASVDATVGGTAQLYYDTGRLNGSYQNGTIITGGYTLADRYNNAVRYPDEVRIYNEYTAAQLAAGNPAPEISLRMLLERMNSNPNEFTNALVINLHGELIPFPPMRNYSDAAKSPANSPNLRIVSHPEKMSYTSAETVGIRVYPYAVSNSTYAYGFVGQYYNNATYTAPIAFSRSDSAINFDWGAGRPSTGTTSADAFSAIWRGAVRAKSSETYTFKLYVNGIADFDFGCDGSLEIPTNASDTGAVQPFTWTTSSNLTAGTEYLVRVRFAESLGNASVRLTWQTATIPEETITFPDIPLATVYFPGVTFNTTDVTVQRISGGSSAQYQLSTVADLTAGPDCRLSNTGGGTLLKFYNSPVLHPFSFPEGAASSTGGINRNLAGALLYGLEYIPCPVLGNDFTANLLSSNNAKNTARWIINVSPGVISGEQAIETRIGDDLTTGVTTDLSNLSKTYVWVDSAVPYTEQYQYIGDPRHCPYIDVKQNLGYNCYFSTGSVQYTGFTETAGGWSGNTCEIDVPRFFQAYRDALIKNTAIWSAINGWSYYYFGLGGEFGSDQAPWTGSIYFNETPWNPASTAINNYNEITSDLGTARGYSRIVAKTGNTWYARFWLGELYPDNMFTTWSANGNLPTGTGNFYRPIYNTAPFNSDLLYNRQTRTSGFGCASFFNNGTAASHFMHLSNGATLNTWGAIQALGNRVVSTLGVPLLATVSSQRPFVLNDAGNSPPEVARAAYSGTNKTAMANLGEYYEDTNTTARSVSALLNVVKSTNTFYAVVSGFGTSADFGTSQIGRFAVASVLQAFLECGLQTGQGHVPQIPRVDLTSPGVSTTLVSPSTIDIQWNLSWLRWDGEKYTTSYADGYAETTPVVYILKYSNDGGSTWRHCTDGTTAAQGERSASNETSATTYTWGVSGLLRGTYIIRVECYRNTILQHYAYDQVSVYIQK